AWSITCMGPELRSGSRWRPMAQDTSRPDQEPVHPIEPAGPVHQGSGGALIPYPRVFFPAAGLLVVFVAVTAIFPETGGDWIGRADTQVVQGLGWYYIAVTAGFVGFSIWIALSHMGNIVLGKGGEDPEYSLRSWFAMLFAAGMGIGLVFWGVAEPLNHFAGIPNNATGIATETEQGAQDALVQTFLHWGLHPWAVYVVVGLAVAYTVHRKKRPVSIRYALEPLAGRRVNGWLGDLVDIAAIVGTLFG